MNNPIYEFLVKEIGTLEADETQKTGYAIKTCGACSECPLDDKEGNWCYQHTSYTKENIEAVKAEHPELFL